VNASPEPAELAEVDPAAELGPRNSQAEGIGRVAAVAGMAAWNNLGRNVVFADAQLRPRAVWASTRFPHDDEPSQYDLDVHAVLPVPSLDAVVVVNHLGDVRRFDRRQLEPAGPCRPVEPVGISSFRADVERIVLLGGALVGSRPRAEGAAGLIVSQPLDGATTEVLEVEATGEHLGEVTALEVLAGAGGGSLAVGGPGTVALAGPGSRGLDRAQWRRDVPFRTAVLAFDGRVLWAAGPNVTAEVDDYDWESLTGGGYVGLDPADGSVLATGPLPTDTAWGTGGVAVVPLGPYLAAVGRDGAVRLVEPRQGTVTTACGGRGEGSLGIAHAAVVGGHMVFGFNRGGFRVQALTSPRTA
jgi:hypothetical protein